MDQFMGFIVAVLTIQLCRVLLNFNDLFNNLLTTVAQSLVSRTLRVVVRAITHQELGLFNPLLEFMRHHLWTLLLLLLLCWLSLGLLLLRWLFGLDLFRRCDRRDRLRLRGLLRCRRLVQ